MSFWQKQMDLAIQKKTQRAMIQAKAQHPDFKLAHPDEARDASTGNFTVLKKRVKEEVTRKQKQALERRIKLAPRN